MRRAMGLTCATLALAACEIQEVVIAEAEPFVVVESFLTAGLAPVVALHASAGSAGSLEADALVQLIASDTTLLLERVDVQRCLSLDYELDPADFPGGLACYAEPFRTEDPPLFAVRAEQTYRLEVLMPDGTRLEGTTRVPEPVAFVMGDEAAIGCHVAPWTQAELAWNTADGAAAYILDLRVYGIREALQNEGIEVDVDEPLMLRGVSIGERDTTIVLPAEVGVFDRFGLDPEIALALQRGLPAGVDFTIVLAAVDKNFVDWVRGGDFNPSGPLRTPSLHGAAGTGVLGSITTALLTGHVREAPEPGAVPCGPEPTS